MVGRKWWKGNGGKEIICTVDSGYDVPPSQVLFGLDFVFLCVRLIHTMAHFNGHSLGFKMSYQVS